jgi:transitional endoplasmic reticulum ATPase
MTMCDPFEQRPAHLRRAGANGFLPLALRCARNVYDVVDRRMPEACALARWLAESATALGLPEDALPDDETPFRAKTRGLLAPGWHKVGAALARADRALCAADEAPVHRWLGVIADTLGLDPLEARILALALHYRLDRRTERLFDALSECRRGRSGDLHRDPPLIALLLGASVADIDARLVPEAKLLACGLLQVDRDGDLEPLKRLTALIRRNLLPAGDLRDQLLGPPIADALPWEAFAHLGREAEVAASVLRDAVAGRERGINLLLYGPPGTGKTSFAATLAARIGAPLSPVGEADEEGDEPQRFERLAELRLAQRLTAGSDTLLLFDEAEDLFADRSIALDEPVSSSRVFMHRLLERTAVPVIWTANDIGVLGPAVLRRMTMCIALKVPSVTTRARLWRRMGETEGVALAEADATRLARLVPAAPAVVSTALRATRLAGGDAENARLIVEGVARAVAGSALPAPEAGEDQFYDPELVNADCDLVALADRLARPDAVRAVSFLVSGPPGSGKSAWVRHLAARIGLPVLQKRASDVLNAYLGGTERNLADAFAEAREAGAFLVFDEADSLLLERGDAVRSWDQPGQRDADLDGGPPAALRLHDQPARPPGPRQPATVPGEGTIRLSDRGAGAAGVPSLFRRPTAARARRAAHTDAGRFFPRASPRRGGWNDGGGGAGRDVNDGMHRTDRRAIGGGILAGGQRSRLSSALTRSLFPAKAGTHCGAPVFS